MHGKECMASSPGGIAAVVDDEPGPAGDFVKFHVTTCEKILEGGL